MQNDLSELERRLWDAADELRANSALKASEYGSPVLGLIFLRFADTKFTAARGRIEAKASARRSVGPSDYHAERVIYLTDEARFHHLLSLPESADLGRAINDAMRAVEAENPHLSGVLPKSYASIENSTLASLLRHINGYTKDLEGDAFGLIYGAGVEPEPGPLRRHRGRGPRRRGLRREARAAHLELRELAARAAKLEAGVDRVLAQLLRK